MKPSYTSDGKMSRPRMQTINTRTSNGISVWCIFWENKQLKPKRRLMTTMNGKMVVKYIQQRFRSSSYGKPLLFFIANLWHMIKLKISSWHVCSWNNLRRMQTRPRVQHHEKKHSKRPEFPWCRRSSDSSADALWPSQPTEFRFRHGVIPRLSRAH